MTLQNLVQVGHLKPHEATADEIQRLLTAVDRNLSDASVQGLSSETRFDCAYKAIMQCALIAMLANGYRPSTSAPGHHQTMIQSLPLTLGIPNQTWIVLEALRKKRNRNDYTGTPLLDAEAREAIAQAKALVGVVMAHLKERHSRLLR